MTGGVIPTTSRRPIHPAWEFISLVTQPAPLRCALTFDVGLPHDHQPWREVPRDATRGGVNGPALPGQRGREGPLSVTGSPFCDRVPSL
jgi:hypothetical protein